MKGLVMLMAALATAMHGAPGLGGDGEAWAKTEQKGVECTIVALGDSLTEGYGVKEKEAYPARLERKLHEAGFRWRVINAGISGERSGETLIRINNILELKPVIVILEIGVNDGFQGLDPLIIRGNIEKIVHILKKHGISVVLAGMRMFDNQVGKYNAAFASLYPEVAKKNDIILIPHFLEGVTGDPALNRLDGIHPNAKGYRVVVDTVYPYLLQAVESRKQYCK